MNGKELKQLFKIPRSEQTTKKKPPMLLIWSIIGAIVFLALSGFSGGDKKDITIAEDTTMQENFVLNEYVARLEERLVSVLENIEGAGKVTVFVSMESTGERIPATDVKTESQEKEEELRKENRYEREEAIILNENNSGHSPYIIEEKLPQPAGVLVIAEGAREERVKLEIYEAVRALFGLAAHRIKVSY